MMKGEAEKAIRALCHQWGEGLTAAERKHPTFDSFKSWLQAKGYSHYLKFRSTAGPEYDAEMWFDQEFKQTWRR